jgi:hypothetical protein
MTRRAGCDSFDGPRRAQATCRRRLACFGNTGGAVSGFFGAGALALEVPVTTTLILGTTAEVARRHGEDRSKTDDPLRERIA